VIGWPFIEAQDVVEAVPAGAKQINLHINSPGGDVFEGMAIYNFFAQSQATIQVSVDGLAASSASLVAMAGSSIQMAPASFVMIHQPWTIMLGDADELRKEADLLDKISSIFAQAYARRTGKTEKDLLELMRAETWLTPQEALDSGFADSIAQGGDAGTQALFNLSVFNNSPYYQQFGRAAGPRPAGQTPRFAEDDDMNQKLRAMLEKKGLDPSATEEQAWAFLADLEAKTNGLTPEEQGQVNNLKGYSQEDLETARKEAAKAERERQSAIRKNVRTVGLDETFAQELIDGDYSVEQARDKIFAKMEEVNPPFGAGGFQVLGHDQDKFRHAVIDGQCMRAGVRLDKPAEGAEAFRGAPMDRVALECLERAGVDTRSLRSRTEIAAAVLHHARYALSTDDFTSIFLDVQNKSLLRAYQESPRTFMPLVTVTSASDFKTIYGISLSEMPDLDLIKEDQEYKYAAMSDKQESYAVKKYGKLVRLTREMIINDDLRAFTRIPMLFGAAAARQESDIVWALITGNPTMADGVALFHADHSNLEGTSAGIVTGDRISNGRTAMRTQTGMQGSYLNLIPSYLLVPAAQETDAEILVRSATLPETNYPRGTYNWSQNLAPIAEPRLDANSTNAWFLAADPSQIDIIEMAYLDGRSEPYTEEQAEFVQDAIGYKVRHEFGAQVMDYRGLFKNPGA